MNYCNEYVDFTNQASASGSSNQASASGSPAEETVYISTHASHDEQTPELVSQPMEVEEVMEVKEVDENPFGLMGNVFDNSDYSDSSNESDSDEVKSLSHEVRGFSIDDLDDYDSSASSDGDDSVHLLDQMAKPGKRMHSTSEATEAITNSHSHISSPISFTKRMQKRYTIVNPNRMPQSGTSRSQDSDASTTRANTPPKAQPIFKFKVPALMTTLDLGIDGEGKRCGRVKLALNTDGILTRCKRCKKDGNFKFLNLCGSCRAVVVKRMKRKEVARENAEIEAQKVAIVDLFKTADMKRDRRASNNRFFGAMLAKAKHCYKQDQVDFVNDAYSRAMDVFFGDGDIANLASDDTDDEWF